MSTNFTQEELVVFNDLLTRAKQQACGWDGINSDTRAEVGIDKSGVYHLRVYDLLSANAARQFRWVNGKPEAGPRNPNFITTKRLSSEQEYHKYIEELRGWMPLENHVNLSQEELVQLKGFINRAVEESEPYEEFKPNIFRVMAPDKWKPHYRLWGTCVVPTDIGLLARFRERKYSVITVKGYPIVKE